MRRTLHVISVFFNLFLLSAQVDRPVIDIKHIQMNTDRYLALLGTYKQHIVNKAMSLGNRMRSRETV
jgi:hypothetical protein